MLYTSQSDQLEANLNYSVVNRSQQRLVWKQGSFDFHGECPLADVFIKLRILHNGSANLVH